MDSNLIVNLKLYKGKKILKDEKGDIENENQTYKVMYGSEMWRITITEKKILNQFDIVKLIKVTDKNGVTITEKVTLDEKQVDINQIVEKELEELISKEAPLTAEQKRIKELEARLAKLEKKEVVDESNLDIEDLKAEYLKLSGEKPHHLWKADKLAEKIEELKK